MLITFTDRIDFGYGAPNLVDGSGYSLAKNSRKNSGAIATLYKRDWIDSDNR